MARGTVWEKFSDGYTRVYRSYGNPDYAKQVVVGLNEYHKKMGNKITAFLKLS